MFINLRNKSCFCWGKNIYLHSCNYEKMGNLGKIQLIIYFVLLLLPETLEINNTCPSLGQITSCKCSYSPENQKPNLKCFRVIGDKNLKTIISAFDKQEMSVLSLNSIHIDSLEKNIFINHLTAEDVRIYHSSMRNISLFGTFHGMENTLHNIELFNSFIAVVILESAEKFINLRTFYLSHCQRMHQISNIECHEPPVVYYFNLTSLIPYLPKQLSSITINKCEIRSLQDHCFGRFTNLSNLNLSHNQLETVNRSCLPRPATNLFVYDLSFNPITFLPDDTFIEMPALKEVSLEGTRLSKLHYHIFSPAFKQLKSFAIKGIPLICDCDSAWLFLDVNKWRDSGKTPGVVRCILPVSLKNREVDTIVSIDMCMNCEEVVQKREIHNVEESKKENKCNAMSKYYIGGRIVNDINKISAFNSIEGNNLQITYLKLDA